MNHTTNVIRHKPQVINISSRNHMTRSSPRHTKQKFLSHSRRFTTNIKIFTSSTMTSQALQIRTRFLTVSITTRNRLIHRPTITYVRRTTIIRIKTRIRQPTNTALRPPPRLLTHRQIRRQRRKVISLSRILRIRNHPQHTPQS